MQLDTVNKSLEIILSGAITTNQLPFTVGYVDESQINFALVGASANDGLTNNTTAVTMVAAPGASITRKINNISIYNNDTVSATVTVRLNNTGTFRTIIKVILGIGDNLIYTDTHGWQIINSTGTLKVSLPDVSGFIGPTGSNGMPGFDGFNEEINEIIIQVPDTSRHAMLDKSNTFTLINPIITIAESWIGPSSTTGIYFKGGNVGIGTTSPQTSLHVNGGGGFLGEFQTTRTAATSVYLKFADNANTAHGYIGFDPTESNFKINASGGNLILNESVFGGNVGIGTTGPGYKLEVAGTARVNDSLTVGTGDATDTFSYVNQVGAYTLSGYALQAPSSFIVKAGGAGYAIFGNSYNAIYIEGSGATQGNVGINTLAPTAKLHVVGLVDYANNAAAVTGGLTAGAFYTETGTNPKRVCVVY